MVTFSTSFKSFQGLAREFIAEFLGTFLLVFLGNNAVAESILTGGVSGNNITIYFGYGFGLFLGLIVSANVSGGHLNPAVTIAGAVLKRFNWSKVFHYILAQYLGAFVGACATYLVYLDTFQSYHTLNGINQTTASVFASYPKENLSVVGSFIDQIIGSMILILAIYAITDPFNKVPGFLAPIYASLTLISIACSLGINQGFAINPARDFSPRLFTYVSYWGAEVFGEPLALTPVMLIVFTLVYPQHFSFRPSSYWYVTVIGPHIGAVLGGSIYVYGIEKIRSTKELMGAPAVATIESSSKNNLCSEKNEGFSHL